MPNLSKVFQRRQLPGVGDHPELYPYSLSEAVKLPLVVEIRSSVAEVEDWREGLKDLPAGLEFADENDYSF
jgi:hypothetical protein